MLETRQASEIRAPEPLQAGEPPAESLVRTLLHALLRQSTVIRYCMLRDGHRLAEGFVPADLDLLVDPRDLAPCEQLLRAHGFRRRPAWGYAPHRFFEWHESGATAPLKVDLVTRIAFGRPVHRWSSNLARYCLASRRRHGLVFLPSPEDELITLLLHCVIDKQAFRSDHRYRLQQLALQVDQPERMDAHLREYWAPQLDWSALRRDLLEGAWDSLAASRLSIVRRWTWRHPFSTALLEAQGRILRPVGRAVRRLISVERPRLPAARRSS